MNREARGDRQELLIVYGNGAPGHTARSGLEGRLFDDLHVLTEADVTSREVGLELLLLRIIQGRKKAEPIDGRRPLPAAKEPAGALE